MSVAHNNRIARAIVRLSNEHGLPNKFGVQEIADMCGLTRLNVGRRFVLNMGEIAAEVESENGSALVLKRIDGERPTMISVTAP